MLEKYEVGLLKNGGEVLCWRKEKDEKDPKVAALYARD